MDVPLLAVTAVLFVALVAACLLPVSARRHRGLR